MRNDKDNLIVNLTFQFSLEIIRYCEQLESIKKYNLSNQLFRYGTSIGANVREAQNAESKADFIHKMKIAAKEPREQSIGYFYARSLKAIQYQKNSFQRLPAYIKF